MNSDESVHSKTIESAVFLFSPLDYGVFATLLIISLAVGIYFGFFAKKKQDTTLEYLMGSKQMSILPIAVSLTATYFSAIAITGTPSEVYRYGTQLWAVWVSVIVVPPIISNVYLPVFYELQVPSTFIYLHKRFDYRCRKLASILYSLSAVIFLPIIIYAPAVTINQVAGFNIYAMATIMSIICIVYTTIGGIRAVVWTDTIQFLSIFVGIVSLMVLGIYKVGGIYSLYDAAERGGRFVWFNMDTSTASRSSFFTVSIGYTFLNIAMTAFIPEAMQRLLAVPTFEDSKKALWTFTFTQNVLRSFCILFGVIVYAQYETCDPVTIGVVKKPDQIMPYYVMDVTRNIPGLTGIFMAGVVSAALSSMSSSINSTAGAIYIDIVQPIFPNTTEKTSSNTMKIISIAVGLFGLVFVFIVDKLGNMFALSASANSITVGPLFGLFTMGLILPKANRHGAFWGCLVSVIIVSILVSGSQIAMLNNEVRYETLPFRTDGCQNTTEYINWKSNSLYANFSSTNNVDQNKSQSNVLFRINFMYYSLIGAVLVFAVGYPISLITGGQENVDPRLLAPFVRRRYEKQCIEKNGKINEMQPLNK